MMKKAILTFPIVVFSLVTHLAFAAGEAAALADQEKQKVLALSKRLDTNGDGGLSKNELDKTHSSRFSLMQANFDQMDANKDGKVTLDEQEAWSEAQRKEQFKQMDTDNDGKLSPEERKAWAYKSGR